MPPQTTRRSLPLARPIRRPRCRPRLEELESRLTPSGIGPDFRISYQGPDGDTHFGADAPAVAFNPGNPERADDDEYLVVWTGYDSSGGSEIYGQRINAVTGRPIEDNFRISPEFGGISRNPAIAYNSHWNQYLVVWSEDFGRDGFRINTQRLNAVGEPIEFARRVSDVGTEALTPAVAYNSADNRYLVVWEGRYNFHFPTPFVLPDSWESEIFGQQVGPTGNEVGGVSDFRISDMGPEGDRSFLADAPAVVYNSTDRRYLVVWSGDDNTGLLVNDEYEIFGQQLDANADSFREVGTDFRISDMGTNGDPAFGALHPALTHNSTNNEYLVVWDGNDGTDAESTFEIYGQRLAGATGVETGDNDFRISDAGPDGNNNFSARAPSAAYNFRTNRYVVVWSADDDTAPLVNDEFEVFGQTLDANPATFRSIGFNDFRVSFMGPNGDSLFAAISPAIASSDTEFLAVWSGDTITRSLVNDEFEIFGHRVGSTERPEAFFDVAAGELLIYGASQDDALGLSADVQGNIVITSGGKALIPINPQSGQPSSPNLGNTQSIRAFERDGNDRFDFSFSGFEEIGVSVFGEDGDDSGAYRATAQSPRSNVRHGRRLGYEGGDGRDTFQLVTTDLGEEISMMGYLEEEIPCNLFRIRDLVNGDTLAEIMAEDAEDIVVDTRGGADLVAAAVDWAGVIGPPDFPVPLSFDFKLGAGLDTFLFDFSSEVANRELVLQVDSGSESDQIAFNASKSVGPLHVSIDTADGDDVVTFDASGIIGPADFRIDTGKGADTVMAAVYAVGAPDQSESRATINAVVNLGDEADTLQFDCLSVAVHTDLNFNVDAGRGRDNIQVDHRAFAPNILAPWCSFTDDATISLGFDDDTLEFNANSAVADTYLDLNVDGGEGKDAVQAVLVASGAWLKEFDADVDINLGAQDDTLAFENYSAAGDTTLNLNVDAAAGADVVQVALEDSGLEGPGKLVANVVANLGLDNDIFELSGYSYAEDVNLKLQVDGSLGGDVVRVTGDMNPKQLLADFAVNLSAGANIFEFTGEWSGQQQSNLNVGVAGGTGIDDIRVRNSSFTGLATFQFNSGGDADKVTVENNTFTALDLNANTGTGKDFVNLSSNRVTDATRLNLNLATDDDQLMVAGFIWFEQKADVFVDAGAGKDQVALDFPMAPRTLRVLLGANEDTADISLGSVGNIQGGYQIVVEGGTDNDRIAVKVSLPQNNAFDWDVRVLGETGNDNLSLSVAGNPGATKSRFVIDGGAGIDTYAASDFVKVLNCEKAG